MKRNKQFISVIWLLITIVLFTGCVNDMDNSKLDNNGASLHYNITPEETPQSSAVPKKTAVICIVYRELQQFEYKYEGELTPQILMDGITSIMGNKVDINFAMVKSDRINVDLKPTSAPLISPTFDENSSYQFEDVESYVYCTLDSIMKTLNKNYGEDKAIYFSVNGKSNTFQNLTPPRVISPTEPYMGFQYYKEHAQDR